MSTPQSSASSSVTGRLAGVMDTLRARPVTSSLFVLATFVWVGLCVLVGMPIPEAIGLWLAVALITVGLLAVRRRVVARRSGTTTTSSSPAGAAATPTSSGRLTPILAAFVAAVAVMGLIQLIPYRDDRTPPPTTGEPEWATAETRELMVRACFGCHSNEVDYPPYAEVAPISWLVQAHIDDGRGEVNYSRFATDPGNADESIETILDGSMPPAYYTAFGRNPQAVLTPDEVARLVDGLRATPGLSED